MHPRSALALLLIAASLLVGAPAASASEVSSGSGPTATASARCGKMVSQGAYQIRTRGVSCRLARRIVRRWRSKCGSRPNRRCRVRPGFTCRYKFGGYDTATVKCTRGTRYVRWLTG